MAEAMDHCSRRDNPQPRPARSKLESQLDKLKDEANSDWREKKHVLEYLRRHVRRHPSDGDKLVEASGVSLLMNFLTDEHGSHSPSPPMDITRFLETGFTPSKERTKRIVHQSTSTEQTQVMAASLHLLAYLTNSNLGRSALSTEQSLRTFLRCMGNGYEDEARSLACRCLGNLLSANSVLDILSSQPKLTAEVVQALKSLVSPTSSSRCLTIAIRTARQASTLKRDLIRAGFVGAVGTVLVQLDDVEVLQHALSCMTTFANELTSNVNKEKGIITPVINEKDRLMVQLARENRAFIPRLITLTSHETPGIQQSALDLLCLLSTNGSIRGDMGSNGVMACFLEHLGFDEGQTTVSSMQKKIVYALSTCCHDGYNRVKLNDLGGIPVLLSVLSSPLYDSVHLHILSCLPEFRHDERTLESLIKNRAVPLATRHFQSALQLLFPSKLKTKAFTFDIKVENIPQSSIHSREATQDGNTTVLTTEHSDESSQENPSGRNTSRTPQTVTYSASSPSYQREVMASSTAQRTPVQNRRWPTVSGMLDSPVFSPPSIPQEMREYGGSPVGSMWSGNPFSPGPFSAQSSPASVTSPSYAGGSGGEPDGGGGRWSPVVSHGLDEEAMDTDSSQLAMAVANLGLEKDSASTSGSCPQRSPLKRKLSDEASENTSSSKKFHTSVDDASRNVNSHTTDKGNSKWTKRDAEKAVDYIVAFFGSISYRNELAPSLTGKSTLSTLTAYLSQNTKGLTKGSTSSQATPDDAASILSHIIRSHLCFQPLIKHGFPLMLHHPDYIELNIDGRGNAKEKKGLLRQMRSQAESHFGFGELLHLYKRSQPEVRSTCIASAALLLQCSNDRKKFFEKEAVMGQLMEVAMNVEGNGRDRVMFAQALHGFFIGSGEDGAQETSRSTESLVICIGDDGAMDCCEYSASLLGLTSTQEATLTVDDGQYLLVNRERLSESSEVFGAMLTTGHFMEGQRDNVVKISQTSVEALTVLVHHFSGCQLEECAVLKAAFSQGLLLLEVIQLSDQYLAFELKQLALKDLVERRLTSENIAEIYVQSVDRQLGFVADEVLNWALASPTVRPLERAACLDALLASPYGSHVLQDVRSRVEAKYI